jgi:hypothetical protein
MAGTAKEADTSAAVPPVPLQAFQATKRWSVKTPDAMSAPPRHADSDGA